MFGLDDANVLRTLRVLEISLIVAAVLGAIAVIFPSALAGRFARFESALSVLALRRGRAILVLFVSVVALRLLVLPLLHLPVPGIHDEFSYLLMSDTFVHGRLANPTHPLWISFETFHVNWNPAYASMYPPAQGAALAVGQILGNPWFGVLLSVAAIGGALALGAMARIAKRVRVGDAIWLGLGIAILANSRPYEGFLFCLPIGIWFLWWLIGKTGSKDPAGARFARVVAPLGIVLVFTAAWMGYYNWRLTGNPMLMPHVLNTRTYHTSPLFLWERAQPAMHYRNQQFEDFYNGWERENYHRNFEDAVRVSWEKIFRLGVNYFWPGLLFAIPAIPFALRDRKMRFPLITLAIGIVGVFVVIWSAAHYAAPITCAMYLLIVQCIRHLRAMHWRGQPVGKALSRAIILCLVLDAGIDVARGVCDPLFWPCEGDPSRAAIAEKLEHTPGKHLIVVRYSDDEHNIHDDWIYNGAEIDNAKVLWARELDAEQNAKLLAYFKDRKTWLVTPDIDNTYLAPYTPPTSSPSQ
jgi:hypothetical protein